jgi:SAM-dependent methyltransferase
LAYYQHDLAEIHDIGYGDFARHATKGLLTLFRIKGIVSGTIVDLGCGSGIAAEQFVHAGYDVFGVDYSEAMLSLCRTRVPSATFVQGSLWNTPLPPCSAITSMGECLNYLFDADYSEERLRGLFENIFSVLQPGGIFACDFIQNSPLPPDGVRTHVRKAEDWSVISELRRKGDTPCLTRHITLFYREGETFRRSEESHPIHLLSATRLANLLRETGFQATIRRGYDDFRLSKTHRVLIAQKRS